MYCGSSSISVFSPLTDCFDETIPGFIGLIRILRIFRCQAAESSDIACAYSKESFSSRAS